MRSSNIISGCGWLWICSLVAPVTADEVTLNGGARLTGTVRSMDDGVLALSTPLAPEVVAIKNSTIEKVAFTAKHSNPKPPPAVVELANGDLLPASIEALDDAKLVVVSPDAGRLEIARGALKSLQLGITRRNVIYAGPHSMEEWSGGEAELKNWTFDQNKLIATGPASASKLLDLPEQFIVRFNVNWQARQIPNFQVAVADSLKPKGEVSDRYYLQFGGAGLEIKRESSKGKRWSTIVQLNRNPAQYANHQLQVELRVDRKGSRVQLFLNGEPEGEFIDPIPTPPSGSGISLVCNAPNGSTQEFSDIEVLEFDDAFTRHHAEERGDSKIDSLISRDDDRWGGQLLDIKKSGDSHVFRFKSTFQNDLVEIPEADVSTVFFAVKDASKDVVASGRPLVLRMHGSGALQVTSCSFSDETVTATHPLLGPLTLRRDGIIAMERATAKPAPEP